MQSQAAPKAASLITSNLIAGLRQKLLTAKNG
jgi:hypothetical protein